MLYVADLYNDDDLAVRDRDERRVGLALSLSQTSGRYACEVRADSMDQAVSKLIQRAVTDGWCGKGWRAHITLLDGRGQRVVRQGGLMLVPPPADVYRHVSVSHTPDA